MSWKTLVKNKAKYHSPFELSETRSQRLNKIVGFAGVVYFGSATYCTEVKNLKPKNTN